MPSVSRPSRHTRSGPRATIRGTVRDATQAIAARRDRDRDQRRHRPGPGLSDQCVRRLLAAELPIGHYRVEAELSGFKKASRTGVVLRVADDFSIDFELAAGGVNETVNVEASSTPVKVLGGDVSGVITGEQVRELPLNGRNFLQLATLMPGVSAPDFLNVKDKGLLGGSDLSVSGSDVTANIWTVDGANNNDVGRTGPFWSTRRSKAIQEFKILRNSYGPEFGGAGGAQINIVTRGGTNSLQRHRLLLRPQRRVELDRLFSQDQRPAEGRVEAQRLRRSFGGPIIKDKLHFFAQHRVEPRGSRHAARRRSCRRRPSATATSAATSELHSTRSQSIR